MKKNHLSLIALLMISLLIISYFFIKQNNTSKTAPEPTKPTAKQEIKSITAPAQPIDQPQSNGQPNRPEVGDQGSVSDSGKFTPRFMQHDLKTPLPENPEKLVERISDEEFKIGLVHFFPKTKRLEIPARICQTDALVEYILVNIQGRAYESLLETEARPTDAYLATLLMKIPNKKPINIRITWPSNGPDRNFSIEELIGISSTGDLHGNVTAKLPDTNWIFGGSVMERDNFVAEREGAFIAILPDTASIIYNQSSNLNKNTVVLPNRDLLPSKNSPVKVIFQF